MNNSEIYSRFLTSIIPLALFNSIFVISIFVFLYKYKKGKIKPDEQLSKRGESIFIGMWMRQWWFWFINPLTRFFINLNVHPDVITLLSFIFSLFAAFAYYNGNLPLGGWLTLLYGTLDIIDGRVARATGKISRRGAFLDSVLDRYSELITYFALLFYTGGSILYYFVLLMIMGSILVSYIRARGEAVGLDITMGMMQRPERIVYLGITSALSPLLTYALSFYMENPKEYLFIFGIVIIAIFSNITAIQRIIYAYKQLS